MWMVVMGVGAALGIAALVGIVWALRKLHGQKKWGVLVGFLILGAGGAFMVMNATALTAAPAGVEDFDPEGFEEEPLDDWGDEDWGEEGDEQGDDDWADEAEPGAEAEPAE